MNKMRLSFPSGRYFHTSFLIGHAIKSIANSMNGAKSCAQNLSITTS